MIEILDDRLKPAKYLAVAFTGVMHGLGGLSFEFYKSLSTTDCAALFVRDLNRYWYQYEEDIVQGVVRRIRAAAAQVGAERVVCLGNSMGGFGALLFGSLAGADAILGFVPQSGIEPAVMDELGDPRFMEFRVAIPAYPFGDLLRLRPAAGQVVVCCGTDEPFNTAHLGRLRSRWRCETIIVPDMGHDAARQLKARGELMPMVERVVVGR